MVSALGESVQSHISAFFLTAVYAFGLVLLCEL